MNLFLLRLSVGSSYPIVVVVSHSFCYKAGQNEESVFCDMNRLCYFVMGFF